MPGILKALVDLGWPLGWSLADAHTWPLPESVGAGGTDGCLLQWGGFSFMVGATGARLETVLGRTAQPQTRICHSSEDPCLV